MSIAGIFKEVTTILLSTWFFGDSITLVNWIGLIITFGGERSGPVPAQLDLNIVILGIVIFTHYKYEKSVSARDQDDGGSSGAAAQEIALPAYTAVASEDDVRHSNRGEYVDDDDDEDDRPLISSSSRQQPNGRLQPSNSEPSVRPPCQASGGQPTHSSLVFAV